MTFTVSLPLGLVIAGFVAFIIMAMLDENNGMFGNGRGCIGLAILIVCWLLAAGIWLGQALGGATS